VRGRWGGAKENGWDLLRNEPEQSPRQVVSKRKEGLNVSCFTSTSLLVFFHYYFFTDVKFLKVSRSSIKQYISTGYCWPE